MSLERQLLCNLAHRLRKARQHLSMCRKYSYTEAIEHSRGAYIEAWNSFQAAKAIYYTEN